MLRCLRALRLLRLGRVRARLKVQSTLKQSTQVLISFVVTALTFAHVYACVWFALGRIDWADFGQEEWRSWMEVERAWPTDNTPAAMYSTSIYWSLATMSTIGYGDIVAANEVER